MEVHVARKYRLGHKIGSGSFGVIYIGTVNDDNLSLIFHSNIFH